MIRSAADLGQQNIPEALVKQLVPVQTLYWRVASNEKAIEVWRDNSGKFYVIEGDYKDQPYGIEDIHVVYEPKDLSDAKGYVKANYQITIDDYTEEVAVASFKRLVRKIRG